jgi:hypothetical protein
MKFNTKSFVLFGALAAILAGLVLLIANILGPGKKDTPVVIVGGSIHPKTAGSDPSGWTATSQYRTYTAAAKATTAGSPVGIDLISFKGFDSNPGPISNTRGWAVTYSTKGKNSPKLNALHVCSDGNCNASAHPLDGSKTCTTPFNPDGPVNVIVGDQAWLEEKNSGAIIGELHFHDTEPGCDKPRDTGEGTCDKINDVQVETCSQGSLPQLTCNKANGKCKIIIGK